MKKTVIIGSVVMTAAIAVAIAAPFVAFSVLLQGEHKRSQVSQ